VRRSKEIMVLLALLLGAVAFVLWYVADRRAARRAAPAATSPKVVGPLKAEPPFVPLGGANEGKTIDFSSGKPVVTDSPEDRAALEKALREIAEATRDVTFGPGAKAAPATAAPAAPAPAADPKKP
jgi:uncharacterized membrane protein